MYEFRLLLQVRVGFGQNLSVRVKIYRLNPPLQTALINSDRTLVSAVEKSAIPYGIADARSSL
jgi:hypothetical protein